VINNFSSVFTVDVTIVGHYAVEDLVDVVSACSVHAKVTNAFLDSVPKQETYDLPVSHGARNFDANLTSREIQSRVSRRIPQDEHNHLEILSLYQCMIEEFEEVQSMKQTSLLPKGDFSTHHSRLDLDSLFYLLRLCNVPGVPRDRSDVTTYDALLRTFLSR
jgi:hypothetical protein